MSDATPWPVPENADLSAAGPNEAAEPIEPGEYRRALHIAGLRLLLDMAVVCEITERPPIARIPNTPPWLLGLANHRGNALPVFDLGRACGNAPARVDRRHQLLVIGSGEDAIAVIADRLPMHIEFHASDRRTDGPAPPAALARYVTGRFLKDAVEWLEFDHESFFEGLATGSAGKSSTAGDPAIRDIN